MAMFFVIYRIKMIGILFEILTSRKVVEAGAALAPFIRGGRDYGMPVGFVEKAAKELTSTPAD